MRFDVKTLDHYRAKAGEFRAVRVPPAHYLMVDGSGDPNTSSDYSDALHALFPLAYRTKFLSKRQGQDFTVGPLEGLVGGGLSRLHGVPGQGLVAVDDDDRSARMGRPGHGR